MNTWNGRIEPLPEDALVTGRHFNRLARILMGARGLWGTIVKVLPDGLRVYGGGAGGLDLSMFAGGILMTGNNPDEVTIRPLTVVHAGNEYSTAATLYPAGYGDAIVKVTGGTDAVPHYVCAHYVDAAVGPYAEIYGTALASRPTSTAGEYWRPLYAVYLHRPSTGSPSVVLSRVLSLGDIQIPSRWA